VFVAMVTVAMPMTGGSPWLG